MVQKVQVLLVDDIDGSEAAETVTFALDGVSYEVDLSEAHAAEFRADMEKWVAAGRRVKPRRARGAQAARVERATGRPPASVVRDWAVQNGFECSKQGRISEEVRAAYDAAHPES